MRRNHLSALGPLFGPPASIVVLALAISLALIPALVAQQPNQAPDNSAPSAPPGMDNLPPVPNGQNAAVPPVPNGQNAAVPPVLTIPAGTFIAVRLMGTVSSDINQQGDGFSATLEQPIVVDGWVVARRGQIAIGRVVEVQKAGRVKGVSSLEVALSDLPVVDGRQLPVLSQLIQMSAGTSKGRDAVAVASTTGLGAGIGGAVDGGVGAGIGAAAGAAVGIAGVLLTPGRPTVLPSETLLTFRVQEPITVNTQHTAMAFLPVGPQDYASSAPQIQARQVAPAYPGGPPYPYPGPVYPYPVYPYAPLPYWGGWGFYPAVSFVGYYGGYGRGYGVYHGGHWH